MFCRIVCMKNNTPLFPDFHLQTLRRKPRSAQQIIAAEREALKQKSIDQLGHLFGDFIDRSQLAPNETGKNSRRRLYSKENTFWGFLTQVLDADGGCKEVVRKIQSYAAVKGLEVPSSSTASYCEARGRLDAQDLRMVFSKTAQNLDQMEDCSATFERRVVVVDGTGLSMPDTEANQAVWPQQSQQKEGCGFPTMRMTACFSLNTGAMLSYATGSKHDQEIKLFRSQWEILRKGDIVLGDKGFCNYRDLSSLKMQGVDSIMAMRKKRPLKSADAIKTLGDDDLLVAWKRPKRIKGYTEEEWNLLPEVTRLRQIKINVEIPGFRSREIYLVTTLLDPEKYPADAIRDLYLKRWDVELFFRDIKITSGMDILRCKTPGMIYKEILMHAIAYNCVRRIMLEAAEEADVPVRSVSYKGALQAIRNWAPHLNQAKISQAERFRLISELYACITQTTLCHRPGRSEPRAKKRRPKNYHLLTNPRHKMHVPSHRNRNGKKKSARALS